MVARVRAYQFHSNGAEDRLYQYNISIVRSSIYCMYGVGESSIYSIVTFNSGEQIDRPRIDHGMVVARSDRPAVPNLWNREAFVALFRWRRDPLYAKREIYLPCG